VTTEAPATPDEVRLLDLQVRSFKGIESLDFDFTRSDGTALSQMLFIGPNATGKTSLLEAIGLLTSNMTPSSGIESSSRFSATDFEIKSAIESNREIRLGSPPKQHTGAQRLLTWRSPIHTSDNLNVSVHFFKADSGVASGGPSGGTWEKTEVLDDLEQKLVNAYTRRATSRSRDPNAPDPFAQVQRAWQKFEDAQTHLDVIQESDNPGSAFRVVVRDDREIPADVGSLAKARKLAPARADIPSLITLDQLSAGQQRLFSFIGPLVFRDRPAEIVLIDEAESHLHPTWAMRLIPALREVVPHAQIIATTHSPYLVDQFQPEEIFTLYRDQQDRVSCARLREHPDFERLKTIMSTGEFWSSAGEQWVARQAKPEAHGG
jgi:predicted ATPase